jgi:hypothetical protein
MAGSRRTFVYVDGDENAYAVVLDEDVGNNQLFGFEPYTGTPVLDPPPQGFRMRYINAVQTTGAGAGFRYRKFACGSEESDLYSGDVSVFTVNGLTYSVTSTRGERSRRPTATNTGLVGSSPTVGTSTGSSST